MEILERHNSGMGHPLTVTQALFLRELHLMSRRYYTGEEYILAGRTSTKVRETAEKKIHISRTIPEILQYRKNSFFASSETLNYAAFCAALVIVLARLCLPFNLFSQLVSLNIPIKRVFSFSQCISLSPFRTCSGRPITAMEAGDINHRGQLKTSKENSSKTDSFHSYNQSSTIVLLTSET